MSVTSVLSRRGERRNVGRGLLLAGLGFVLGGSLIWVASSQQAAAQNTAPGVPVLSTMMFTDSAGKPIDAASVDRGQRLFRDRANCKYCHGWNGKGSLVEGEPPAPALTTTVLAKDDLVEVISCGRIGKTMPTHLQEAWTPAHPCYGLVAKDIDAKDMPRKPFGTLNPDQISDVANYVLAVYRGKDMTWEVCASFFNNANSHECDQYKK